MNEYTIYALGFFDGVHLGHAALLKACRELAGRHGWKAGVVTFSDHPDTLVTGRTPALICTPGERERLMKEQFHMDTVVTLPFDEKMRARDWKNFLDMLIRDHGAAGFVCGEDFRFGARGEGNARTLYGACCGRGFPCAVVPQLRLDGQVVSSTHIRSLIEGGKMESATKFLGHPYTLTGTVIHGRALGRKLGVPTANLVLPQGIAVPKFGVYACRCMVDGASYSAVTNVGTRPTVSGNGVTVEPWILGYEGDLYNREIRLEFHYFLRPEIKFQDLSTLKEQIQADAAETKAYFEKRESR